MAAPVPAAATDRPAMPAISFVCFIESFPRRERDGAAGDRTSEGSRDPVIRGHYKRGGGGSPALFDTRRQDATFRLRPTPGRSRALYRVGGPVMEPLLVPLCVLLLIAALLT